MSIRRLLGLEGFPLHDEEIMARLREAYQSNREEIIFSSPQRRVRVKLSKVSPLGMMRGYEDYYAK